MCGCHIRLSHPLGGGEGFGYSERGQWYICRGEADVFAGGGGDILGTGWGFGGRVDDILWGRGSRSHEAFGFR